MKELFEGAIKFREEDFNEHKELYESLNEAMEGYIETKIENNLSIPIP